MKKRKNWIANIILAFIVAVIGMCPVSVMAEEELPVIHSASFTTGYKSWDTGRTRWAEGYWFEKQPSSLTSWGVARTSNATGREPLDSGTYRGVSLGSNTNGFWQITRVMNVWDITTLPDEITVQSIKVKVKIGYWTQELVHTPVVKLCPVKDPASLTGGMADAHISNILIDKNYSSSLMPSSAGAGTYVYFDLTKAGLNAIQRQIMDGDRLAMVMMNLYDIMGIAPTPNSTTTTKNSSLMIDVATSASYPTIIIEYTDGLPDASWWNDPADGIQGGTGVQSILDYMDNLSPGMKWLILLAVMILSAVIFRKVIVLAVGIPLVELGAFIAMSWIDLWLVLLLAALGAFVVWQLGSGNKLIGGND
ncbi:hypothetical protein [Dehalococcoides mccartyi]|uniref:hypothetical protein n=1 Tax=Dehalococcoides mccartyi TaxID=61435 RepID=UPI0003C80964|nr:hypothetical protein [Dehalococcoides mccartyi]AHB12894.1 putative membrane protein [Dehalococcoides mccartyi GY50]